MRGISTRSRAKIENRGVLRRRDGDPRAPCGTAPAVPSILRALTIVLGLAAVAAAAVPDPGFDAWGGWRGVATTATGRFRVERVDGVWWLVTPAGHGFFSVGVDHLRPEGDFSPPLGTAPYHDNIIARYGSEGAWATATRARLADLGVNTIGAFSQPELFPGTIAYTVRLNLSEQAPAVPGAPPALVARITRDYFDPAFETGVVAALPTVAGTCAGDPWCIGVFTDNEVALGASLAQVLPFADAYLLLPPNAPGKLALQAFLEDRYAGDVAAFNATWGVALGSFADVQALGALSPAPAAAPASPTGTPAQIADRRAFDAHVAERFHRVTHDALRAFAPDLLILGSRLLILSTRPEVLTAIAPWVDVVTVNYYEIDPAILAIAPNYPAEYGIPFVHMFDDLDTMHRLTGKPLLIGEFSYRAADSGLPNTLPPFFPTLATQADRAHALGTYLRRVIARPYLLGAHWFQYMDQPATGRFDGENQNFGLVTITDDLWPEVTDRLRSVSTTAAARRLLAPGGGQKAADCTIEWASTSPLARAAKAPKARFVCRDGDPACDVDAVAGQCTIEVAPCTAVPDDRMPACAPIRPSTGTVAPRGSVKDAALASALGASLGLVVGLGDMPPAACGPAVAAVLPLGGRRSVKRTLQVSGPTPFATERDAVRLACVAAP
jgi:agarase